MPRFLPSLHLFTSIQLRKTIIKSTVSISISAETASWGFPTYAQKPHYFVALSDYTYLRPVNEYSVRFELLPGEKSEQGNLSEEPSASMILAKTLKNTNYYMFHSAPTDIVLLDMMIEIEYQYPYVEKSRRMKF